MATIESRYQLIEDAKRVLAGNDLGASTKPAPNLYPHQWNWDSCFIAIGISRFDTARAAEELRSLLKGQWRNGFVPQIVFNPKGAGYFPGPDVWQSSRSPDAPPSVQTSGITQPPVLATAALAVWENATNKDYAANFLCDIYPGIFQYHQWMYEERDPDGIGLIVVLHPWESGLDNSPPYLHAGKNVRLAYRPQYERLDLLHVAAKNRPTNKDYDLFVYLLEQMRNVNWDQRRYLESAPLQIVDVLFNSILCRANQDLARIAEIIGEDPSPARQWRETTRDAINQHLWDDEHGTYYDFDRVEGQLIQDETIACLHTLYGGVAPADRAERLVTEHLQLADEFWPVDGYPIPTTAANSTWFNPENYWLGPTWVNTNWMVLHGLRDYGYVDLALHIQARTIEMVQRHGFREYYNPVTGEGYGTDSFSWTAALTLDLLSDAAG